MEKKKCFLQRGANTHAINITEWWSSTFLFDVILFMAVSTANEVMTKYS